MNSPSEVKARASKLRDVLISMGHQLKHSESLEVISKIEGYPDWNTYTAYLSKKEQVSERYSKIKNTDTDATVPDHSIIDAIKLDNEALLRESLNSEVLNNKIIMVEAFYQSVVLERTSLAEVMIGLGADISSIVIRQLPLFEFVIHTEREEYLQMLIFKFKNLRKVHGEGSSVLPLVVSLIGRDVDALETVKILLDQGANINAKTREGETAIILAGWLRDDLKLVTYLVERGADVNIANNNGDTPLIDAAYKGNIEIIKYLLDNGAHIETKNNKGHSALDVSRNRGNSKAARVIIKRKELE